MVFTPILETFQFPHFQSLGYIPLLSTLNFYSQIPIHTVIAYFHLCRYATKVFVIAGTRPCLFHFLIA